MQRFVIIAVLLFACQAQRTKHGAPEDGSAAASGGATSEPAAGSGVDGSGGAPAQVDAGDPSASCTRCGLSNLCCAADEQCVGERCLAPCAGVRCGDADELCCGDATPLCAHKICIAAGIECAESSECGASEICEPLIERCLPGGATDATCWADDETPVVPDLPVIGSRPFDAELLWEHTGLWASSMPLVLQLSDDNTDKVIDDHDVPDVLVAARVAMPVEGGEVSPLNYAAFLSALSGDDGRVLAENRMFTLCGDAPAAADLDGDGRFEIVATACALDPIFAADGATVKSYTVSPTGLMAFNWQLARIWGPSGGAGTLVGGVSIADLDADGTPEIIAPPHVLDSRGNLLWDMAYGRGTVAIADIDLDGQLEIIWGGAVYKSNGTLIWTSDPDIETMPIVARVLLGYPGPQVALVSTAHEQGTNAYSMFVDVRNGMTGEAAQGPTMLTGFSSPHASLPVLGDFDGFFGPDFGIGIGSQYLAIRARPDAAKPALIWSHGEPRDTEYGAGSTAFDFDGDGTLELVVASNCALRVLAASDATELWSAPSGPSVAVGAPAVNWGLPVVADVDGDGHADLLVSSQDSEGACDEQPRTLSSIRVYREHGPGWTPARKLWNQYAYSIDNITDDGEVPRVPVRGWETHNTYRINRAETEMMTPATPPHVGMPDLVVSALSARREHCPAQPTLLARIENQGEAGVPEGVAVTFYEGGPAEPGVRLGAVRTRTPLLAGAATWVELGISDPPLGDAQTLRFFATVDESVGGASAVTECDEQNNTTAPYLFACTAPVSQHQPGGFD